MQESVVVILVIGALGYLGWRLYIKLNRKTDCGPDCGCDSPLIRESK